MSVISEVKCGRCDRKYSGFRSRCPYCGARRSKRGKHADDVDNAKAKLVIGVILLVVLIGATMVLIITSLPDPDDVDEQAGTSEASPTLPDDESGVTSVGSPDVTISPSPSPSPSSEVTIASVTIVWAGDGLPREDVSLKKVGDTEQFTFKTVPEADDVEAVWESTDEDVFMVVDGKVTAVGKGWATLKCTVEGVTGKCIVRVQG